MYILYVVELTGISDCVLYLRGVGVWPRGTRANALWVQMIVQPVTFEWRAAYIMNYNA